MAPPPGAAGRDILKGMFPARLSIAVLLSLALSGCYATLHGSQSTGSGATASTTSGHVGGTARFAGGSASFSSGQPVSPNAPGGHLALGKGASAVLIVGLVLADLVNYLSGGPRPTPLPADARIMDTCSCYQEPAMGNGQ